MSEKIPRVIKFKTGVVLSKLLLSGVKVQFNQLPDDNLSLSAQVNKHKYIHTNLY